MPVDSRLPVVPSVGAAACEAWGASTSPSLAQRQCDQFAEPCSERQPALFLDRDGVVIEDGHYLSNPDQVKLCPGAKQLIESAHRAHWPVVIVTNQSGIARGLFSWDAYRQVNARMLQLLGPAAPVAAIYASGDGPEPPADTWRKPSPGMLLEAERSLNLDLSRSVLAGDRLSDLQAGQAAGLGGLIHVLSRHGARERSAICAWFSASGQGSQAPSSPVWLLPDLLNFPRDIFAGAMSGWDTTWSASDPMPVP